MRAMVRWAVVGLAAMLASAAFASTSAKVTVDKAPDSLEPGEKGDVTITVKNTGTESWDTETYMVVEAVEDPEGNDVSQSTFDVRRKFGPLGAGQSVTLGGSTALDVEAPPGRGEWQLEAHVEVSGVTISGEDDFTIEVKSGYDGKFVGWSIAQQIAPDSSYAFEITVENTGKVWWDPEEVALSCIVKNTIAGEPKEGEDAFQRRWDATNDDIVYPGDTCAFSLRVRSPEHNGEWELDWQMYDLEEDEPFGQKGLSVHTVATTAGSYSAKLTVDKAPSTLDAGEEGAVQVTVENKGRDWPVETYVVIEAVEDPQGNTPDQTSFSARSQVGAVAAGQIVTLGGSKALEIEAPPGRGEWKLEAWVEVKGSNVGGTDEFEIEVEADYDAKFTGWRIEKEMKPYTKYTFQVIATNTGDVWWDAGEVMLDCQIKRTVSGDANEGKKAFQGRWKIEHEDLVYQDDPYTFILKLVSPPSPGEWEVQWQMYDLQERDYFGQKATSTLKVE